MQTNNVNVDKLSTEERKFKTPTSKPITDIRDKIIMAIEITKRSKVPALFFSNPGYGKTTTVCSYARLMGMHVEELIGSQYSQDEILGFQSKTDKSYLEILEPEWYHRIVTYAEPHYEKISSGLNFTLVEEEDVAKWTDALEKANENVKTLEAKISNIKADIESNPADELKSVILKATENELERAKYHVTKYTSWLKDVEWRKPRASILFMDELSTASPNVQGSILNLVFNRKIRGNKELPEDCIILSAANYKANLPGFNDIMSPQLNRFCLVNLLPGNKNSDPSKSAYENLGINLVNEFLQDFHEVDLPLPQFNTDFKFNDETNAAFLEDLRNELIKIIRKYTGTDTSRAILNFRNITFDGIYDRDDTVPEVYNFMSPRTMSYYARVVRAMCEMGITSMQRNFYECFIDGLLGLGTNNWDEDDPLAFLACITDFHNSIYDMTTTLLNKYRKNVSIKKDGTERKIKSALKFSDTKTITGKIKSLINMEDHKEFEITDPAIQDVIEQIIKEICVNEPSLMIDYIKDICSSPDKVIQFRSDLDSIKQLIVMMKRNDTDSIFKNVYSDLEELVNSWMFYYNELAGITFNAENSK